MICSITPMNFRGSSLITHSVADYFSQVEWANEGRMSGGEERIRGYDISELVICV